MSKRDFLSVDDVEPAELAAILDGADRHKADRRRRDTLDGRSVALVFEKPSTRTRVSFEVAVHELGGYPLPLAGADLQLGRGETLEDTAAVLSRYVHAIVLRTFAQESLERLARGGTVPVVNALSDYSHPCQALADLQTIRERKGRLAGIRLAYLGDGNNVAHSLLFAGAKMGMHVAVATPVGYEPIPQVVRRASEIAAGTGGGVELTHDPATASGDDHGGQDGADAGGDQQQPDPQGQLHRLEGQVGLAAGDRGGQGGGQGGGGHPGQEGRGRPAPPPGARAGLVVRRPDHPRRRLSSGRRSR